MIERNERAARRLRRPFLIAGWVCVVVLCGYVYIAIDRQLNNDYLPVLIGVLVLLVIGLVLAMIRRPRRRSHLTRNE